MIALDIEMPGMDGFQVLEGLKKIEMDGYLPVLVITGHSDYNVRALNIGAKDFISTPFDRDEVLARVHNLLEVRLLHKESKRHSKALEQELQQADAELTQVVKRDQPDEKWI
jgi:adenylate cyclase